MGATPSSFFFFARNPPFSVFVLAAAALAAPAVLVRPQQLLLPTPAFWGQRRSFVRLALLSHLLSFSASSVLLTVLSFLFISSYTLTSIRFPRHSYLTRPLFPHSPLSSGLTSSLLQSNAPSLADEAAFVSFLSINLPPFRATRRRSSLVAGRSPGRRSSFPVGVSNSYLAAILYYPLIPSILSYRTTLLSLSDPAYGDRGLP